MAPARVESILERYFGLEMKVISSSVALYMPAAPLITMSPGPLSLHSSFWAILVSCI